jgi:hypothetical protein
VADPDVGLEAGWAAANAAPAPPSPTAATVAEATPTEIQRDGRPDLCTATPMIFIDIE